MIPVYNVFINNLQIVGDCWMEKEFDVVVVGAFGVDTYVFLSDSEFDVSVEGQFSENVDSVGLAGGYSSIAFARMGLKTAVIGYVGDDHNGRFIRETLDSHGIITRGLQIDPYGTKRSINFIFPDGRRKSFYDGKGSMYTRPELDFASSIISRSSLAHVNIVNWARFLLPSIRKQGLTLSCDLQDIIDPDDPYRRDFANSADILFFSSVNKDDPAPIIRKYLSEHPNVIVVSGMGNRGCSVGIGKNVTRFPAVDFGEPVVDTTGAGDSLAAGFLCSWLFQGHSIEDSILRGQIAARYACSTKANSSGLITMQELNHVFDSIRGLSL